MTLDFSDSFDVTQGINADKLDTDLGNINQKGVNAITNIAMPSSKYDSITGGASGTQYTAPADGYYLTI